MPQDGQGLTAGEARNKGFDHEGNILWQKGYANYVEAASLVKQTSDGGFMVLGQAHEAPLKDRAFVMKLDDTGNVQWQRFFDTGLINEGFGDILETASGYVIAGSIMLSGNRFGQLTGPDDNDAWLVKLDQNGNLLWQRLYGAPPCTEYFGNVFPSPDGGLIVGGATWSFGAGNYDLFIMKLDSSGELPGCSIVKPASAVFADLLFKPVTTELTVISSPALFAATDPGLVAVDTNYLPGNLFIEGTMSLPSGQHVYNYTTDLTPSLNTAPDQAKPLALGHIAESYLAPLSLRIGVLPFSGPSDAYLGIYAPTIGPEIWLFRQDNSLQPLSQVW